MSDDTALALPPHVVEQWRRALERGEPRALELAYALKLSLPRDTESTSGLSVEPASPGGDEPLAIEVSAMLESAHALSDALKTGSVRGVDVGNPNLFSFERSQGDEQLLLIYNLTPASQPVKFRTFTGMNGWDILNRVEFVFPAHAQLEPYEFLWLLVDNETASHTES